MKRLHPQNVPTNRAQSRLVQIEKPIYGGSFLARDNGKAVFVPLTLPGEQARVRVVHEKRGYLTAEIDEVVTVAPQRIAANCRHFGACGGCHYQHTDYATQLTLKQEILRETLERGGVRVQQDIAVLSGNPWAYRNRIRLALTRGGSPGYRERRSHSIIAIQECPIAAPLLVQAALAAAEVLHEVAASLHPSELVLFCNSDETELLASVIAATRDKRQFDEFAPEFNKRVPALCGAELAAEGDGKEPPHRIARWGEPALLYCAGGFDYDVGHGAFFQANRWLIDALLDCVTAAHKGKLAWDLFAGVGLFARRLTTNFERVVAVESAPAATSALAHNLRDTSGEAVKSETLGFLWRRDRDDHPDLIVVDPPRTGLGAETTSVLAEVAAPSLVYVSCDPSTLARDLRVLTTSGYEIESVTLADLFPQTFHLETVVHLNRSHKPSSSFARNV